MLTKEKDSHQMVFAALGETVRSETPSIHPAIINTSESFAISLIGYNGRSSLTHIGFDMFGYIDLTWFHLLVNTEIIFINSSIAKIDLLMSASDRNEKLLEFIGTMALEYSAEVHCHILTGKNAYITNAPGRNIFPKRYVGLENMPAREAFNRFLNTLTKIIFGQSLPRVAFVNNEQQPALIFPEAKEFIKMTNLFSYFDQLLNDMRKTHQIKFLACRSVIDNFSLFNKILLSRAFICDFLMEWRNDEPYHMTKISLKVEDQKHEVSNALVPCEEPCKLLSSTTCNASNFKPMIRFAREILLTCLVSICDTPSVSSR